MSPRKNTEGITVAVTGASGYVATRLIDALCADAGVERVLGFDVRPALVSDPKFVFDHLDVRNPTLRSRLQGVDTVVHLAFIMDPIHDEALMRDVNVNGSANVFRCAGEAGVRKIIYTSSATVYGAHRDNKVPLNELSPLRANLDFSYPAHKLEVEYIVKEFREEFRATIVTVFRPAIVFGAHVDNAWSHVLELPVLFGVRGYLPPIQFLHEDDAARALSFAITHDLDGEYNVAADGWLEGKEALAILGRRRLQMSEPAAFSLLDRLWSLGLTEAPAGMLHYLMHPWVVSTEKLADEGFFAQRTNEEALRETAERAARYVRFGKRRMRRTQVVGATAAGIGLVGVAAGVQTARRLAARS